MEILASLKENSQKEFVGCLRELLVNDWSKLKIIEDSKLSMAVKCVLAVLNISFKGTIVNQL